VSDKDKDFTRSKLIWLEWIACDPRLSPLAVRIAVRLAKHMNRKKGGDAFPAHETLSKEVHATRRAVISAIEELERAGYLAVTRTRGRKRFNVYRGIFPGGKGFDGIEENVKPTAHYQEKNVQPTSHYETENVNKPTAKMCKGASENVKPTSHESFYSKPSKANPLNDGAEGVGEGKQRYGPLLAKLLKAAADNVARDKWGIVGGIDQVEPILFLIDKGCSLEADVLPAIAELVPPLTEPLDTWNDPRIRDACLARKRTRQAATTEQQRRA
jgi:Helix-turn-helix domain